MRVKDRFIRDLYYYDRQKLDGENYGYSEYGEHTIYLRDKDDRESRVARSWDAFKIKYPYNAKLLELLFGMNAKEAHMDVKVLNEANAMRAVNVISPRKTEPAKVKRIITFNQDS